MTRVDFYLVSETGDRARQLAACKLTGKAFRLGHRVYVLTASAEEADALDNLLWTFSAGSFIPHALQSEQQPDNATVMVGSQPPPEGYDDVLITLAPSIPDSFSRFHRLIDIVGASELDKEQGRTRFRFYRDRGYALETHPL